MHHRLELTSSSERTRLTVLFVVGWGTLWAWLGTINGSFQITQLLGSLDATNLLSFIVMGSLAAWRIVLAIFSGRASRHLGSTRLAMASSLAIAACTAGVLIGLQQAPPLSHSLLCVGCILCTLGVAWLSAAWVYAFAHLREHLIFLFIVSGFLLASLTNLSISWLPASATILCATLFPLVSGFCFALTTRSTVLSKNRFESPEERATGRPFASRLHVAGIALGIFCYGLAGSIVRVLSRATSPANEVAMLSASSSHTLGIALCAATLLVIVLVRQDGEKNLFPSLSKVMLAVMAFGMLLPGILPAIPFFLADFVMGIAIGCFEIMLLTYAAIITRQQGISPLRTLGIAYGSMEAAGALSYPLILFSEQALNGGFAAQWSTIALVALFAFIIVSVGVLIPFADKQRAGGPLDGSSGVPVNADAKAMQPDEKPEERISPEAPSALEALLRSYGLTERELEVALLLSEGRNVPYIQEHLVISQGTAQTHTYHIYQKLGIHSKQELIEIARNSSSEQV